MKDRDPMNGAAEVGRLFDDLADGYLAHSALEREVASRLLSRLAFLKHAPARILDLGSGPGKEAAQLKRQHRKAQVIALDVSMSMCRLARKQSGLFHPLQVVCADLAALPFPQQAFDLVVSNLALQWQADFPGLTAELRRVLRPEGFLLFSTLGPGSLNELKSAGAALGWSIPAHPLPDLHDLGDALLAAGFARPVMDTEFITMEYRQSGQLLDDLRATGALARFLPGTPGSGALDRLVEAWQPLCRDGIYPLTWEIVYGAAFGPGEGQAIKSPQGDVVGFSVDHLRKSVRRVR